MVQQVKDIPGIARDITGTGHDDLRVLLSASHSDGGSERMNMIYTYALGRLEELRRYPQFERKVMLFQLLGYVRDSNLDAKSDGTLKRWINSELLEITCLSSVERAYAMLHLAEAIDASDEKQHRLISQLAIDAASYAEAHDLSDIATVARRLASYY